MITDVGGVRVGHWTDHEARTGCTVVLLPPGTVASGEVRGGAPATREFDLLHPARTVGEVHAVFLSGGSAFGLATGDGVMRWLEQQGVGFATVAGVVPIVVGMSLFDLMVGDPRVRPGPDEGYAACVAADGGPVALGQVGAGAGASVGAWRGPDAMRPGAMTSATARQGDVVVSALVAVNAYGDVDDRRAGAELDRAMGEWLAGGFRPDRANTTIGVVATNARLDKAGCLVLAQGAHDGLARSLFPPHSRLDGDAFVAVATGEHGAPADLDLLRALAVRATEDAIRSVA